MALGRNSWTQELSLSPLLINKSECESSRPQSCEKSSSFIWIDLLKAPDGWERARPDSPGLVFNASPIGGAQHGMGPPGTPSSPWDLPPSHWDNHICVEDYVLFWQSSSPHWSHYARAPIVSQSVWNAYWRPRGGASFSILSITPDIFLTVAIVRGERLGRRWMRADEAIIMVYSRRPFLEKEFPRRSNTQRVNEDMFGYHGHAERMRRGHTHRHSKTK